MRHCGRMHVLDCSPVSHPPGCPGCPAAKPEGGREGGVAAGGRIVLQSCIVQSFIAKDQINLILYFNAPVMVNIQAYHINTPYYFKYLSILCPL